MKNKSMVICISFLYFLPGCRKIIKWGKDAFPQAQRITYNKDIIKQYSKKFVAYDELDTAARFDVLWLSDQVRTEYARLHTYTHGKSDEFYQALLRRQLEENKHFITFYVLSVFDVPLGTSDSEWALFLQVDGHHTAPSEIKSIDILPEYKTFLAKQLSKFRTVYRVIFDAKDIEDKPILTPDTKTLTLVFRSTNQEFTLQWPYIPPTISDNAIVPTSQSEKSSNIIESNSTSESARQPVDVNKGAL
ncbi:MAG TPA: hypothetical protein VGW78_01425 [Candidatus Babeliales bacterium]|jgi:hypothetical protein|nr:hypothetical protein [Candidatus Babeliales bacterium]